MSPDGRVQLKLQTLPNPDCDPLEITAMHTFAHGPLQTRWAYRRPSQNGLILPAAAILDELSAAVPVPVADSLLVDVPDEVIPLAVELSPPSPVPVDDAVELAEDAPDEPDDELDVSLVQLAVKKT